MSQCPSAEMMHPADCDSPKVNCRLARMADKDAILFDPKKDCAVYTLCDIWQRFKENTWANLQRQRSMA